MGSAGYSKGQGFGCLNPRAFVVFWCVCLLTEIKVLALGSESASELA